MNKQLLEEQVLKVDLLLDILEGEHLLSRNETSAAPSGAGPAGYEPCRAWPQCLGSNCPSCDGSGYVKSRHGRYDPYLPLSEGPVEDPSYVRDDGPMPIKPGVVTAENLPRLLELEQRQRHVEPPPTREKPVLNQLEHKAASEMIPRLRRSLETLQELLAAAEAWIVEAALRREREGLEYLAKRLPSNAWVPGL